jgi:hypothetical protein
MINSCWLAPALAHPTHTSPKFFVSSELLIWSKNYEICTPAKLILRSIFTKEVSKNPKRK